MAYSIAGANGPNGVIFSSNDGVLICTGAIGGLLLLSLAVHAEMSVALPATVDL